jgi:hypothetical protein
VVCHDPKVGGITVGRAQAKRLPQLPRLDQVIKDYGQRAFLDIELRGKEPGIESVDRVEQNPPSRTTSFRLLSPTWSWT